MGVSHDCSYLLIQQIPRRVQVEIQTGQPGHVATQGRFPLDQEDRIPGVGDVQRSDHARYPPTDHQRAFHHRQRQGDQRFVHADFSQHAPNDVHRFLRSRFRSGLVDPGGLLPDVGYLAVIWIQPAAPGGLAESRLMHRGRTGSHDDGVQIFFLNRLGQQALARVRAHILVIRRVSHFRQRADFLHDALYVHSSRDIHPTMADEHSHSFHN